MICSRTTSMPRSSLALSSSTICRMFLLPYIRRARARTVDVFPVPGGPYRRRCGNRFRPISFRSFTFPLSTYICINKLIDGRKDILVARDVIESIRSVFLYPEMMSNKQRRIGDHFQSPWQAVFCFDGKIGSASFTLRVCIVRTEHY